MLREREREREREMGFVEGSLAQAILIEDDVFPKMLLPAEGSDGNLAKWVLAERESLDKALHRHRALLFRGFDVASVDDLERAIDAFGWDAYEGNLGLSSRKKLSNRVYTANEAPVETHINFHHEMAIRREMPSKIFFYCSEPSPVGGETSIIASDVIVQRMEEMMPEVMAKLTDIGLVFILRTAGGADDDHTQKVFNKSWQYFFDTEDEAEAEKRAFQGLYCYSISLYKDGSAELVIGPMNPVKELGGKRIMLLSFLDYNDKSEDRENNNISFGDGSAIPAETVEAYTKILVENCVDIKWQKGDVLVLDNLAVQHARRPGKPPRCILASICK